jgi:hypothetical protein
MAKKKNKQVGHRHADSIHSTHLHFEKVLRPWCWYCEREFEDEKGLSDSYLSIDVFITNLYFYSSLNAASKSQTL